MDVTSSLRLKRSKKQGQVNNNEKNSKNNESLLGFNPKEDNKYEQKTEVTSCTSPKPYRECSYRFSFL